KSDDTPKPVPDDATSLSTIHVNNARPVGDVSVGLRVEHPRASDMAFHLVSPRGTRILLAENRGGVLARGYGSGDLPDPAYTGFTDDTNITTVPFKFAPVPFTPLVSPLPLFTSGFENDAPGAYATPAVVDGWLVETNLVRVLTGLTRANSGTNYLTMTNSTISRTIPTLQGRAYRLRFASRVGGLGLFNTGVNDDGVPLAAGQADPHYNGVVVNPAAFPRNWLLNSPDSSWITQPGNKSFGALPEDFPDWTASDLAALDLAAASSGPVFQLHPYRTAFDLTGFDLATARILGRFVVDYQMTDLRVNGIGRSINYRAADRFSRPFSLAGGFLPGTNTLDFFTMSRSNAHGFRAELKLFASVAITPSNALPVVFIPGLFTNAIPISSAWRTNTIEFVAASNDLTLALSALLPQVALDSFELKELGDTWYLPEETLKPILGEPALGDWQLEATDSRVGPADPPPPTLLSWRLQLYLARTNPPALTLTNGQCFSGNVEPGETRYFQVNLPLNVNFANNYLSGPDDLVLLFNQNGLPQGFLPDDVVVDSVGANGTETLTLSTNVPPFIQPGQRYYLGVQTRNPDSPSAFTICVNYSALSIIPLTNAIPYTNTIPANGAPDYYSFTVSDLARTVDFELFPVDGNVDLYLRRGPPPPSDLSYDYQAINLGLTNELIHLTRASVPVALTPGVWFLSVYNRETTPVNYSIRATEFLDNLVTLVTADANASELGPDSGVFTLTRSGSTAGPLAVNLGWSGTATNGVDYAALPSVVIIPDGAASTNIIVTPLVDSLVELPETAILTLRPVANYVIGAPSSGTVTIADGPGQPVIIDPDIVVTDTNICLTWPTLIGVEYIVQARVDIGDPVWTNLTNLVATATTTTYCIDLPSPWHFFQVVELISPVLPDVTVVATDANASEVGPDSGVFTVTRSGSTTGALTVNVSWSGTAANGVDYAALANSVTIPDGAASATVTVTPLADALVEGAETAVLTVVAGAGYAVGAPSSGTVTIADGPGQPVIIDPDIMVTDTNI
ncbi:MAG: proprotein convertase P-domain-containing protein, partial [Verrucomicrobia bacterium]|nr:proprotein convertase P-domain-containing protein [Verrucomicrobiota bacterium]